MKFLFFASALLVSLSAFAVPRGLYLASPKSIKIEGDIMTLKFDLNCKNESPDEWAGNVVSVSDDEGDTAMAVGVILAKSSCVPGPKKEFTFTYGIEEAGVTQEDLKNGVTVEPADVKN